MGQSGRPLLPQLGFEGEGGPLLQFYWWRVRKKTNKGRGELQEEEREEREGRLNYLKEGIGVASLGALDLKCVLALAFLSRKNMIAC